jgi:hypothetical protein
MTPSGANWTYVYTPPPGTTNINMVFNDGGAVWDNNGGEDWHFEVVNCVDVPTGLSITNPPGNVTVGNAVSVYTLSGIADGMEGHLAWTNVLTGQSGVLLATSPWSIPSVTLDVGGNEIRVVGTNATVGGLVTNAYDRAADAAYSDGWNSGNNGGTGFLGWQLNGVEDSAGHFTSETGFGMWSHEGDNLSESIRPFSAPLDLGKTFSIQFQNGWIWEAGGSIGFALRNASNTVWEFYFNGGYTNYHTPAGATQIGWTEEPIQLTFTPVGSGMFSASAQAAGGDSYQFSGNYEGEIVDFRLWSYNNGTDDGQNSNRDLYFNFPRVVSYLTEGVQTNTATVIITRQAGGSGPQIANATVTVGGGLQFSTSTSIAGAEYAVYLCTDLMAQPQVWTRIDSTAAVADGGPVVLDLPTIEMDVNHYRIGYAIPAP